MYSSSASAVCIRLDSTDRKSSTHWVNHCLHIISHIYTKLTVPVTLVFLSNFLRPLLQHFVSSLPVLREKEEVGDWKSGSVVMDVAGNLQRVKWYFMKSMHYASPRALSQSIMSDSCLVFKLFSACHSGMRREDVHRWHKNVCLRATHRHASIWTVKIWGLTTGKSTYSLRKSWDMNWVKSPKSARKHKHGTFIIYEVKKHLWNIVPKMYCYKSASKETKLIFKPLFKGKITP